MCIWVRVLDFNDVYSKTEAWISEIREIKDFLKDISAKRIDSFYKIWRHLEQYFLSL